MRSQVDTRKSWAQTYRIQFSRGHVFKMAGRSPAKIEFCTSEPCSDKREQDPWCGIARSLQVHAHGLIGFHTRNEHFQN